MSCPGTACLDFEEQFTTVAGIMGLCNTCSDLVLIRVSKVYSLSLGFLTVQGGGKGGGLQRRIPMPDAVLPPLLALGTLVESATPVTNGDLRRLL